MPAPSFATSGSVTTVTFGASGFYGISARLANATAASFTTTVIVNQLLTTVTVTPVGNTSQITGKTAQFSMGQALDQFGRPMAVSPVLFWSAPVTLLNAPRPELCHQREHHHGHLRRGRPLHAFRPPTAQCHNRFVHHHGRGDAKRSRASASERSAARP